MIGSRGPRGPYKRDPLYDERLAAAEASYLRRDDWSKTLGDAAESYAVARSTLHNRLERFYEDHPDQAPVKATASARDPFAHLNKDATGTRSTTRLLAAATAAAVVSAPDAAAGPSKQQQQEQPDNLQGSAAAVTAAAVASGQTGTTTSAPQTAGNTLQQPAAPTADPLAGTMYSYKRGAVGRPTVLTAGEEDVLAEAAMRYDRY